MAERHCVAEEVFLKCALLLIESVLLLFQMLLDKNLPVVIEVFEYECFVQWVILILCLRYHNSCLRHNAYIS